VPKRLLFVDDEPLVLQGLRRALHSMRQEWEMNFVESGALALAALEHDVYDAIISDMRMPMMDGPTLLEKVKERYPDVVRIVLSGQSSRSAVLRSISPAHQYLSKPCDPQELKLRLAQAFATRDLLNNGSVMSLVSGLKSIPSLPPLYHNLMAELQAEEPSLTRMASIIAKDVGMAAKILQLANSAFMGLRCQVSDLSHAVCMIGLDMLRALVLTTHVFTELEAHDGADSLFTSLWEHSVNVAALAQRIAISEKASKQLIDESFTAGLLHDVGKAILLNGMGMRYGAIFEKAAGSPGLVAEAERELLSCTHGEVGAYLMGIWGLPSPLVNAVGFHDQPSLSIEPRFSALTTVHAADVIASFDHDPSPISHDVQLDETYLSKLGMVDKLQLWRTFRQEQLEHSQQKASV